MIKYILYRYAKKHFKDIVVDNMTIIISRCINNIFEYYFPDKYDYSLFGDDS